jgi:hypothetical protein
VHWASRLVNDLVVERTRRSNGPTGHYRDHLREFGCVMPVRAPHVLLRAYAPPSTPAAVPTLLRPALQTVGLVVLVGDPGRFRSGRHFAAYLGLTPKALHGQVRRLGPISKHGKTGIRQIVRKKLGC